VGLALADRLNQPIYTPSSKAGAGEHDENISFETTCELVGSGLAHQIRDVALRLYRDAQAFAAKRGIIIADTKFEFGLDDDDQLILMDEVLTPDSSRYWPADQYRAGHNPPSFDKQFLRDWLSAQPWDKTPPAPTLPAEIAEQTAAKDREALTRITGQTL
jgi:phosphoribosylaminoimidazole-succinocarboxamide synthase